MVNLMRALNRYMKALLLALSCTLLLSMPGSANISRVAPDFAIRDLSGELVRLAQLRDEGPVLLVFWSTRCRYCTKMIPQLQAIEKSNRRMGLTLAAVNIGVEAQPEVLRFANRHQLGYLILNDDTQKADLAEAFNVVGTPTFVLIEPSGEVSYRGFRLPNLQQWDISRRSAR